MESPVVVLEDGTEYLLLPRIAVEEDVRSPEERARLRSTIAVLLRITEEGVDQIPESYMDELDRIVSEHTNALARIQVLEECLEKEMSRKGQALMDLGLLRMGGIR